MLLSGHQPVYLPSIILFNKIAISNAFMFVGHCQNVVNSWHTRNKIRVGNRSHYLSVPVKRAKRFSQSINETEIANKHWRRKHLLSIKQNYGKRPYFDVYFPKLEALLMSEWTTLSDMNIAIIKSIMEWLDIRTPALDSRDYKIEGHRTDMIISMCHSVGADEFVCNEGSRVYLKEEQLSEAGIQHYWQVFEHPVYEQGKPFMENLSIIDLLFNVGEASREIVFSCGHAEPGPYRPKLLA